MRCSEDLGSAFFEDSGRTKNSPADRLCQTCRLAPPPFQRAVAYGAYSGVLRALIHSLKYGGMRPVADRLGEKLAVAVVPLDAELPMGVLVVPVPLYAGKLRSRGFNHAELLARAAMRALRSQRAGRKMRLVTGVLARRRATESQAGLSPHQRRANLRGAFFVPEPEEVKGRHILLIDDIYTTGATARACGQSLRRAGAASVWVATVARPQRESLSMQLETAEVPMDQDVAFWNPASLKQDRKYVADGTDYVRRPSTERRLQDSSAATRFPDLLLSAQLQRFEGERCR